MDVKQDKQPLDGRIMSTNICCWASLWKIIDISVTLADNFEILTDKMTGGESCEDSRLRLVTTLQLIFIKLDKVICWTVLRQVKSWLWIIKLFKLFLLSNVQTFLLPCIIIFFSNIRSDSVNKSWICHTGYNLTTKDERLSSCKHLRSNPFHIFPTVREIFHVLTTLIHVSLLNK